MMFEAEFWANQMGKLWASHADALDRQLEPAGIAGLEALKPQRGEKILDLGCGSGSTTVKICEAVGSGGMVTGIDISEDQLAIARSRAGNERADFLLGDAQSWPFEPETFDALYSRFGCMFFEDANAAYANLQSALRPDARVALVAWRELSLNSWAAIPAAVGVEILGPAKPSQAGTPGPFAWGEPSVFRPILEGAGFRKVSWSEVRIVLQIGEQTPDDPVKRGLDMLMRVGPLARRLRESSDDERGAVASRLAPKLKTFVKEGWVRIPGRIWVIQAQK